MNITDAILFTNIALLCHTQTLLTTVYLLLVSPIVGLITLIVLKFIYHKTCFQKLKTHISICCNNFRVQVQNSIRTTQPTQDNSESRLKTLPTATNYRESYMNITDAILFTNIALLCHTQTLLTTVYLLLVSPIVGLITLIVLKFIYHKTCFQKLKTHISICCNNFRVQVQNSIRTTQPTQDNSESRLKTLPTATQPLIHHSLSTKISYGTNNE